MTTPSFEVLRSPFDNVMNFITTLPQGHEKAFKQALYNAVAILILFVVSAAGWALYVILEPFIKPLFWALLCGACLYPFKYYLAASLHSWISRMDSTTHVVVSLVMAPVTIVDDLSERVGNLLRKYLVVILALAGTMITLHLLYSYTPNFCVCFIWKIGVWTSAVTRWLIERSSPLVVVSAIIVYIVTVVAFWEREGSGFFIASSYLVWLVLSSFLASFAGSFQIILFVLLQLLWVSGFFYEAWTVHNLLQGRGEDITLSEALKLTALNKDPISGEDTTGAREISGDGNGQGASADKTSDSTIKKSEGQFSTPVGSKSRHVGSLSLKHSDQTSESTSSNATHTSHSLESDKYLYGVMWACIFMVFWKYLWLLNLIPAFILYYTVKHSGHAVGLWSWISNQISYIYNVLLDWFTLRRHAFFPPSLRGLMKIKQEIDVTILEGLKGSIDSVATTVVTFGLLCFTLFTTVFIFFQIYTEIIYTVQVSASIINSTVLQNDMMMKYLPEDWQDQVNSALDNAYHHGREGISGVVRSYLKDVEESKAAKLEQQVLELWDRVYQAWMVSSIDHPPVGPTVSSGAVFTSWDGLMDSFYKMPELFNWKLLLNFAQENVEMLMSVLDSLWGILKGNIGLAFYSVTTLISVIFGGGTAVLNFFLNVAVFVTALFYLLNSSSTVYKPVEMITNFSSSSGKKLAVAVEDAITGVFTASFKMAVFFGLWTWFIHNLFGVEIVYLPSVFAAIFGAVPFLGTYWVCVPTAIDLWLYHGKPFHAVLLFLFHFLPCSTINTVFYSEIKGGGHPYLTGLAVAGGIFCLGVEGAILGPLILCCLLAAINMSGSLMKDSPSDQLIGQLNQVTQLSHFNQLTQAAAGRRTII